MNIEELKREKQAKLDAASVILTKCETEKRGLSAEETTSYDGLFAEAKGYQDLIERKSVQETIEMAQGKDVEYREYAEVKKPMWNSLGEMLLRVREAAMDGATPDPRLIQTRAVSGMNESIGHDGGFMVQPEQSKTLIERAYAEASLAPLVTTVTLTNPNSNGMKFPFIDEDSRVDGSRQGGVLGYWENEGAALVQSAIKLGRVDLELKKLTGLCYMTNELLQDAGALESFVTAAFAREFAFKIDDAIYEGTGIGQPKGILSSGALIEVAKESAQTAATIVSQNVVKMWARLANYSRANAYWLINQELLAQLVYMKMDVGTGGIPLYLTANVLKDNPYGTLFGRPVLEMEQCSALGTKGDIMLLDPKEYYMINKGGLNSASSIHVRFLNDEMVYRFIYRCDGKTFYNKPLTPFKGSSTVSSFVTLATRA